MGARVFVLKFNLQIHYFVNLQFVVCDNNTFRFINRYLQFLYLSTTVDRIR